MINRTTRLRWRRRVRLGRRQVEDMGVQAEQQLERHLFKRMNRLPGVFRFALTWILLLVLLISATVVQTRALKNYYLTDKPVPGGILTEGILGSFTNASPLYATSSVDASVSRLVFAGLVKLDSNNKVVGDLADSWSVDKTEQVYTVHLRDNLRWHDGQPLTADDVVFTYQAIKNPDAKSYLFATWRDIKVSAKDPQTVVFTLPNPFSPFLYNLTTGIVPKHLLKDVPMAQLRSSSFNSAAPVGAGPFKWEEVQVSGQTPEEREEQIALLPFDGYAGGKPKLSKFIIRAFRDEQRLLTSFLNQEISAASGLSEASQDLRDDINVRQYDIPLLGEVLAFFKTSNSILKDTKVRQALVKGTDTSSIVSQLGYPVALADQPLLKKQLGYQKKLKQFSYNVKQAKKLLEQAGWKEGTDGIRTKGKARLSLNITSQDNRDYKLVTENLKKQWQTLGVEVQTTLQPAADLQSKLDNHAYDVLVYGISIGVDPDVFPYWHSSQTDVRSPNRLNFSEFDSAVADTALEAGRTRLSPELRVIKYKPFLEAWRHDAPAIVLYQPRYLYASRGQIFGFEPTTVISGVGRYANVHNWMIREDKLPIQ